ncbi:hypothetical protein MTO96_040301 [Rhipicephalus appendiculatus]
MPRRPFSAEGDPLTRLPGRARSRQVWLGSERQNNADESGRGSPFRTAARTTGRGALVLPRGQGDRGVPRSLAGTPTTMEDGNHPRSRGSDDSRHRPKSNRHGSQAGCYAQVRDDPGDYSKQARADRIRRPDSDVKLCEKHFAPTDFVRTATYTDAQTGKVIEVPLERVRLKETAVPSVFANCPKYMSRPTPSAREAPEEKKVRLEAASLRAAIELSVAAQEEENRKNKVGSFEEFCRALSNFSVSDFWSVIIKESKVVFLDLALQRAPAVRSSVAVSVDLCIDVFIGEARIENLPSVNVPSHLQDLRQLNEVLQSVEQLHVSHSSDDNQKAHRLLKIVLMLLEDVCRLLSKRYGCN